MTMKTTDFMRTAIIKRNFYNGFIDPEDVRWMIDKIDSLRDELAGQRRHEDFLLKELRKLGWFENRAANRRKGN